MHKGNYSNCDGACSKNNGACPHPTNCEMSCEALNCLANYPRCDNCETVFVKKKGQLCKTCSMAEEYDTYVECSQCHEDVHIDDIDHEIGKRLERMICLDCAEIYNVPCQDCHQVFHITWLNKQLVCDGCATIRMEGHFVKCASRNCKRQLKIGYDLVDKDGYCVDCSSKAVRFASKFTKCSRIKCNNVEIVDPDTKLCEECTSNHEKGLCLHCKEEIENGAYLHPRCIHTYGGVGEFRCPDCGDTTYFTTHAPGEKCRQHSKKLVM